MKLSETSMIPYDPTSSRTEFPEHSSLVTLSRYTREKRNREGEREKWVAVESGVGDENRTTMKKASASSLTSRDTI